MKLMLTFEFQKNRRHMIQRIQSIFFLLAAACFGGEFATSFAKSNTIAEGIFSDQLYNLSDHVGLQVLAGLGALLSIIAIFLYKNRDNQVRLGYVVTTLAILLPIAAVLIFTNQSAQMGDAEISDQAGLYLPIGMIICSMLAVRFVKKDNKLVQSMDRLR